MKCPKCSYVSFDFLDACRKCDVDLVDFKSQIGLVAVKPGALDLSVMLQDDLSGFTQSVEEPSQERDDVMVAEEGYGGPPSKGYMTVMLDISDMQDRHGSDSAPSTSQQPTSDASKPSSQSSDRPQEADREPAGASESDGSIEMPLEDDSTIDMLNDAELSVREDEDESAAPRDDTPASTSPPAGYVTVELDAEGIEADEAQESQAPERQPPTSSTPPDASQRDSADADFALEGDDLDEDESFLIDLETLDNEADDDDQTKPSSS